MVLLVHRYFTERSLTKSGGKEAGSNQQLKDSLIKKRWYQMCPFAKLLFYWDTVAAEFGLLQSLDLTLARMHT